MLLLPPSLEIEIFLTVSSDHLLIRSKFWSVSLKTKNRFYYFNENFDFNNENITNETYIIENLFLCRKIIFPLFCR